MSKKIISQGKTTNEAIEKGLKKLNVSKDMVEIKVIEEEKRSFYDILAPRVVNVELTLKDENANVEHTIKEKSEKEMNKDENELKLAIGGINDFLSKFLKKNVTYKTEIREYQIFVNIDGEDISYLIGYRGETINALQTILVSIANKRTTSKTRVFLDVGGYKERRIKTLEDLAEKIARTVVRTGKPVILEPMTAYERKIIHLKLQNHEKVETYSKGEEPYRKVVIKLK